MNLQIKIENVNNNNILFPYFSWARKSMISVEYFLLLSNSSILFFQIYMFVRLFNFCFVFIRLYACSVFVLFSSCFCLFVPIGLEIFVQRLAFNQSVLSVSKEKQRKNMEEMFPHRLFFMKQTLSCFQTNKNVKNLICSHY